MQNLRPIVTQCYRGVRSLGNRQSRDCSSLTTKNGYNAKELTGVRARVRAFSNGILFCGVSVGFGSLCYHVWNGIRRLILQAERANARITQVSNTASLEEAKEE